MESMIIASNVNDVNDIRNVLILGNSSTQNHT